VWIFAFAILFSDKPCFVPFAYGSQERGNVMVVEKNDIISAQVILPSESGKLLNSDTLITSENISQFSPNPATVNKAQKLFRDMGFKVGNAVGVSFSISATAATFEETFKLGIRQTESKGFEFVQADGTGSNELPKSSFGLFSAGIVETVVFMEAPDFGPSDFSM
jgi:subtilase family serine protease